MKRKEKKRKEKFKVPKVGPSEFEMEPLNSVLFLKIESILHRGSVSVAIGSRLFCSAHPEGGAEGGGEAAAS